MVRMYHGCGIGLKAKICQTDASFSSDLIMCCNMLQCLQLLVIWTFSPLLDWGRLGRQSSYSLDHNEELNHVQWDSEHTTHQRWSALCYRIENVLDRLPTLWIEPMLRPACQKGRVLAAHNTIPWQNAGKGSKNWEKRWISTKDAETTCIAIALAICSSRNQKMCDLDRCRAMPSAHIWHHLTFYKSLGKLKGGWPPWACPGAILFSWACGESMFCWSTRVSGVQLSNRQNLKAV